MGIEVKICGLTNAGDAQHALDCGADYLGFVLYPESPRGITPKQMRHILDRLSGLVKAVAVFVNEERERVQAVADDCGLCAVQIHGDEPADAFAGMSLPVWRALRVGEGACRPEPAAWPAARYVVDAATPGVYGGTGVTADWTRAAELAGRMPVMLAGGLTPSNVVMAVRTVRPLGVDTSSGVEARPGKKDRDKVEAFLKAARSVAEA